MALRDYRVYQRDRFESPILRKLDQFEFGTVDSAVTLSCSYSPWRNHHAILRIISFNECGSHLPVVMNSLKHVVFDRQGCLLHNVVVLDRLGYHGTAVTIDSSHLRLF